MAYLSKFDPTLNDWRTNTNNTMNTKHTPGPWHRNEEDGTIANSGGMVVAAAYELRHETTSDVEEANARLIAAAPDLLAALDALIVAIYEGKYVDPYSDVYRDALNARAKATKP
ncbi:MAG: hypothetical protein ACK52I_00840 [Pseudomonadota bacterium]|jgi:hypothetical protein